MKKKKLPWQIGALFKACVHSRENVARVCATGIQHLENEVNRDDCTEEIRRCVCVCVCACLCVGVWVFMHVCGSGKECARMHVRVCINACMCVYVCTNMSVYIVRTNSRTPHALACHRHRLVRGLLEIVKSRPGQGTNAEGGGGEERTAEDADGAGAGSSAKGKDVSEADEGLGSG